MFRTVTPLATALAVFALCAPSGGQEEKAKNAGEAVKAGLRWLVRQQQLDGRWVLNGNFRDKGQVNDTAATAFGLLPLLSAGYTHKADKGNDPERARFARAVDGGLRYLMQKQNRQTGDLGGGMYAHALATMALCRAYGLTKDPLLRRSAQTSVDYIVRAQHKAGGWRYSPGQAGDTSVTSWDVQALQIAKKAGLTVPAPVLARAVTFLDSAETGSAGYCYVPGMGQPSPTMTAAGLTCRQLLQNWDGQNKRMMKGIASYLKQLDPTVGKNLYQTYYVAQVMRHSGGDAGKAWSKKLVGHLLHTQETGKGGQQLEGSWSSVGDAFGGAGGRMMTTSLALLVLEGQAAQAKAGGQ